MNKRVVFLIALVLLAVAGNSALADSWTCPGCGRINSEDMNYCGNCRTEKPTQVSTTSSSMRNAWLCSSCSHICPDADKFCTKCGTDHYASDAAAILIEQPVLEEIYLPTIAVQRFSCSHNNDSVTIQYTPSIEGKYLFWVEDQTGDFSGKLQLYDNSDRLLRTNDFFDNDPGFAFRLSGGETYCVTMKGGNGNPNFTLCIGEPREPVQIKSRTFISDSVDYYDQENTYLFVPQSSGEYRLEVVQMQNGQEIDLAVKDELGNTIRSASIGVSMGNGISFELEAEKRYYIIVTQRTSWNSPSLGPYKLQLSSPNPKVSVSGCSAVGDYLYYSYQKNKYEYMAPETGTYSFPLIVDVSCDIKVSVLDEYGKTLGRSSYSATCEADLTAGKRYVIVVEQQEGFGDYSLIIQKK